MAIKRRDIDRIYNAIRPRLNPKARTGAAVVGTLPAHTHSADQITSEEAGDIAATDVQDALAEVASEKLARDGSQTVTGDLDHDHHSLVNVHDADIEGTATVGGEIVQTGPIGSATVQGTRKITMAGIGLIEAVLKLDFTGAGVGDGIIDQPRVIHMAGDDDDDEARIDGLERTVFNDEPTKSVIQNPSVVQFNPAVSAGVDTVHQEGQVGWDAVERTLVQDAEPAAYDSGTEHPRLSLGWAVINCINGSGDLIPPFKVVYVSGGIEDVGPGVNRPAVSPWDGMADSFGAQLGISQRVTGVTLHGSDDGEPVQVVRRGLVRGITDDNAEVWTVGDRLWADRTSPGRVTKVYDESGEYARIFVGTVIEDGAGEGPWSVDVDVRVLPTLGELSFMALASLADFYVPMFDVSLGWVPKQVDHNAHLATIQGGAADEWYHLTLAEWEAARSRSFGITIDGAGVVITTGVKGYVQIPFAGTITRWTLLADQAGDLVIDVWKDTFANAPPTVADTITGTEKPTLDDEQQAEDTDLATWDVEVEAGDVVGFNVDSAAVVTRATLVLWITPS